MASGAQSVERNEHQDDIRCDLRVVTAGREGRTSIAKASGSIESSSVSDAAGIASVLHRKNYVARVESSITVPVSLGPSRVTGKIIFVLALLPEKQKIS